jgi:sigma-B regulation protein RsbU (phosphoserine phosphatase)
MELSTGGTVLGLFPEVSYEEAAIEIRQGDLLVAFTDGVTEARNAEHEEFGEERLKALLRGMIGTPAEQISKRLANAMRDFVGSAEQHDDLTFIVMTVQ